MKLANRAYMITLILLLLVCTTFAQNSKARSENDDRNTAPTVGTGGPVGGPTGLFTVYDGQTLRKGEYTLSIAYSNFDRDPGNVDITSVPISFQVGLSNHFELFFGTEAYRGIKVNAPRNLSSFYLPNSQLRIGTGFVSGPAIVLAPGTGTGALGNQAVFRPTGTAPFAAFPFTGAAAGNFGIPLPFFAGPFFGFAAGTQPTLGPPRVVGGADLFPGVGSPYGSILPGVVLTTQTLLSPTGAPRGEGPVSFSAVPSYLNDAPFINRTWATSSFNTLEAGFKWRFNSVNDGWGHGITMFYRWYMDNADDFDGFNMMTRGAGTGSNWGDIGLTYFADARVAKWANVSANVGYVYTTKIKGNFGGTDRVILDPGDQLQYAVGLDFPVNKHFQPILEFRGLRYVGGRTPNALENDPMDGIAGFRVFPRRWFGLGFAYRYHFNQQDRDSFDDNRNTSTLTLPCGPLSGATCVASTVTTTTSGVPPGLQVSSDPHGYIAQFWIGRRDKRQGPIVNLPANVESVTLSDTVITLPCPPGTSSSSGACNDNRTVSVTTVARDPENDVLTYNYTVSGGRIVGTGANVQWDLSTAQAGTYTIVTGVDDGCGVCGRTDTKTITIENCPDCVAPRVECSCPTVSVSGPSGVTSPGQTMTFTANVSGGSQSSVTYNWSVSSGSIESGQGTPSITVRTGQSDAGGNVTATVTVGLEPSCDCPRTASETAPVQAVPTASLIDEFGAATPD
ncbi:MAG: hypothetical protein ABR530_03770, partial [Pyrinomonadaceae bacterium]